ncbi:amidohydrolase [Rhodoferax sediminis]|uniref:Amidohydrolase n=2 Tax=Rhodoferax sediminis TaxID=2509614 RepID=A0A515DHE5_9BURK|nr:amidohydrolase [Rhodoferax sediminis]
METHVTSSQPATRFGQLYAPNEDWLKLGRREPALEPDLTIIDTHTHLWDGAYAGTDRYFVEQFARDAAESGHNVEATVYVECHSMYRAHGPEHLKPVGEIEFAVGMAAMAASRKYTATRVAAAIVGYADLTQGERTRETLEAQIEAANGRFRGVRQRSKWDPDPVVRGAVCADGPGLYLEPAFGRGLDLLASLGLAFEASVYHPQIPDITAMARAHSGATILVNHSGSPVGHCGYAGREAENHAQWLRDMRELARCPNVCVKMGGVLMHLANYDYIGADRPVTSKELAALWRPYIEPCIELFGADRCMVESNFPVDKAGFSYGTVWNMFKRITAGCSPDEKRKIFAETARRVYRIERE